MERIWAIDAMDKIDSTIKLSGWVNTRRNMGKIVFIDLRDRSGLVQVVFVPQKLDKTTQESIKKLRPEFVIEVEGIVQKRPKDQINEKLATGEIEVLVKRLTILNPSKTPPFEIDNETLQANEELRLQYRYLDLRHERMRQNVVLRHKIIIFIRNYLDKAGFLEIETPILTKGTPEGAREFVVPSRLYPGEFYVLPQSPQQFKQLLMVAGMDKYFQIARCFRDEDTRGDRQPEFTQLDIEMSFIDQNDILNLVETLTIALVKEVTPQKKITTIPFPRIPYKDVIKKYGTDKPDLRKGKNDVDELAFCFIVDFPLFKYSETEKKIVSVHHPFTAPQEKDIPLLFGMTKGSGMTKGEILAQQYDFVCNGFEIAGGSIRIYRRELQEKIFEILELTSDEIKKRFGHLLEAFEYGAPPHGGIAFGLDRLVMNLANEPNIREIIPFPKTADAKDLMMEAPSELPKSQLEEVHIEIKRKPRAK
ncbi:aspartate--tRNA ligase [Patescibacteria group bacterium AH-259-L07]|nr:aspartate--tRNA ligase [Patescibacteria group bacterium AH-259-L07]